MSKIIPAFADVADQLARYRHPRDPRAVITDRMELFIAAARADSPYQIAILKRHTREKEETKIRRTQSYQEAWDSLPKIKMIGSVNKESIYKNPLLKQTKRELGAMHEALELISHNQPGLAIGTEINATEPHPHDHDVMTAALLGDGTQWPYNGKNLMNGVGKVPSSAWAYFKKNVYHLSPRAEDQKQRIIVVFTIASP